MGCPALIDCSLSPVTHARSMALLTFVLLSLAASTRALPSCSTPNQTAPSYPSSTLAFSTPPYSIADGANLTEFRINIPDQAVEDLTTYVKLFKAPKATYENSLDWTFGVTMDWLVDGVDYWLNNFDWRKEEEKLNSIPQFKLAFNDDDGESYSVHFAALFSGKKDAIPIILSHGWPDLYMIYMPILQKVQQQYAESPDQLPYHLIVPSLIGTGFSSAPPVSKPFYTPDTARIWNKLMVNLGFGEKGYIAQGNDVGTMISEYMLASYDECKASHITLWWGHPAYNATTEPPANALEAHALGRIAEINKWGNANVLLHADRSSTAGLTIGTSPISMLTWIGERMVLWSDPGAPLSYDVIIPTVAVYWFTQTYPTSYWCYAQFRTTTANSNDTLPAFPAQSHKPEGFSWFPNEVGDVPKSYFEDHSDIYTYFYQHDVGGHFSSTEQPDLLWADIEDFVSKVWQG
ncbi:alpha/beta-hydrolase [Nemania abortiva]|nr:alpha/beta-hydrolase [Nemania abortiva]